MENLFFFWGQEDFLINSEIEKIKSKYVDKTFEAMAYKKLYEPKFDDIINAIQSLPMMFGNIMHVIDVNKFFLSDGEGSLEDWQLKQFENALNTKSDKNIVVLRCIIPYDSKKKVDSRKKIYKITSKYAQEKQFPLFRDFDKNLPAIISDLGKKSGLKLNNNVISEIISQLGTNLGIINSELQKLAITIYPKVEPSVENIHEICTQKDNVFLILEAIFKNDMDFALSELKRVLEKSSINEVMGAIQNSIRSFTIIKTYYQLLGKQYLARKLNKHEFIIEKNYNLVSKYSGKSILKLRKDILNAEYAIKTGNCIEPEKTFEMALMGVSDVQ